MSKGKSFLAGVVFGIMVAAAGTAFAVEADAIRAKVLDAALWWDGVRIVDNGRESVPDLPRVLEYRGVPYVSLPLLADGLEASWSWDRHAGRIEVTRESRLNVRRPEPGAAETLPQEIEAWIERSKDHDMAQSRALNGVTWILATWGKKNTGGYDVHIDRIERRENRLRVHVSLSGPDKGELVTEAVTWPYALAAVDGTFEEVEYVVSGDASLSVLRGIEFVPSVAASSQRIIVFAPKAEGDTLRLQGAARSFGGVVVLEVRDSTDDLILQTRLTAAADAPDWGFFEALIPMEYVREGNRAVLYAFAEEEPDADAAEFSETEDAPATAHPPQEPESDASRAERHPEDRVVLEL